MIRPLTPADFAEVAEIHREGLPHDLLARLGPRFLERLYRAMLDSSLAFGFVVEDRDRIGGFVICTVQTSVMFRRMLRSAGPALLWRAMPRLMVNPRLGWRLVEAFLYPNRVDAVQEEAEWLVISMREAYRNGVWAVGLVDALDEEFRRRGVAAYKFTVYDDNARAVRFYDRLGFQMRGRFTLFNRLWRTYTRDLRHVKDDGNR